MSDHWDEFSKSLADGSLPRRESLRRLGYLFAGALLSPLAVGTVWARGADPCKQFCNRCGKGWLGNNCLAVCHACNSDTSRLAGYCGTLACCGAGQTNCGLYCANLGNDWNNCGACGYVCEQPGPYEYGVCTNGNCDYACVEGAVQCDGICTRLEYDPQNCGACGNACSGPDPHCSSGVCSECASGQVVCGDSCADLNWDANHCGECGNVCGGSTPYCSYGVCAECPFGYAMCGGSCIDISFDPYNCG